MENFKLFLEESLKNIEIKYYNVDTVLGDELVRERVFCYELYHQMRNNQKLIPNKDITIFGEMDKRSVKIFDDEKPDFIFHEPGTEKNYLIMEVKNNFNKDTTYNDLKKLIKFIILHSYQYGIELYYRIPLEELKYKFKNNIEKSQLDIYIKTLTKNSKDILEKIYICHLEIINNQKNITFISLNDLLE